MKQTLHSADEIKKQIVDQAFERFGRFGFGKTTMAEIAGDCDMSAGNLYRYFKSKEEIGAQCARTCMGEKLDLLRDIVRRPGITAAARLKCYVIEILHAMNAAFADRPLQMELVDHISEARWDIVLDYLNKEASLLAEILAEGNRTGEFDIADIMQTAKLVQAACIKFTTPRFVSGLPLEQLEQEARGVMDLLLTGLNKR
ncbi:MAG: TetR/AcrR family transcriptional regulator [Candidatus Nitrohelix vancouverensis]|uniref:TetR/AcrR family transcriptional regulator n=1 Tax=Candidatus Nitrohelix vancouverensis TaxID=2705534 RepID=A0A7T0C112_9BACT|nr:MAG: TetR/AcrR family transcriptional regulator [Candidatus Nitrohelix vancouverensis]